ncbi:unnamed protein product, partial [Didymodactylos carnosus]
DVHSRINDTNIAQPTLFALQVALTALWISWGVYLQVIVGHSAGEIAAVYVKGRVTLTEACQIIYHRSLLPHCNTRQNGRMLAVAMSIKEAQDLIEGINDYICIAAHNSPRSITLSGDEKILENLYEILNVLHPKIFKSWLKIENAFHSHQMELFNIQQDLMKSLKHIKSDNVTDENNKFDLKCSQAILYPTVSGTLCDETVKFNSDYWWANVHSMVQFDKAIETILSDSPVNQIYLEISPHPVLCTSIREYIDQFKHKSVIVLHSLKRKENEQQ